MNQSLPKSIRFAVIYYFVSTAISVISAVQLITYVSPLAFFDLAIQLGVSAFIMFKLTRLTPWAVYAYFVLQAFGFCTLLRFANLPFTSLILSFASLALCVWVYIETPEIRAKMNWGPLTNLFQ